MHQRLFSFPFRLPFLTVILEITNQLLLLGIYGNDRLPCFQKSICRRINVLKLSVAIWMRTPLTTFTHRLQAVPKLV